MFIYVCYICAMSEICASDLVFSHSHTLFRANGCKINCSLDVNKGVDPDTKVAGTPYMSNPERSFGGPNGEPPSEASQLRKGGPGVLPRKISKTYMANGAIYVIPELYL